MTPQLRSDQHCAEISIAPPLTPSKAALNPESRVTECVGGVPITWEVVGLMWGPCHQNKADSLAKRLIRLSSFLLTLN